LFKGKNLLQDECFSAELGKRYRYITLYPLSVTKQAKTQYMLKISLKM
jgi:hypothetical protein